MSIWNRFYTRRKKLFLTSLTFSALLALILNLVLVQVSIASQTNVSINPPSILDPTLDLNKQFSVDLWVDYVEPNLLWAYQLTLSFNPDVIHGVSVENGPFMESQGGSVLVVPGPGFNNETGTLGLFAASLFPIEKFPKGGSDEYGPLCTITFEVVGYGSSPITLGPETGLANKTGGWMIKKATNPEFFFDGYFSNKGVYVDPPQVRGVPVGESFTVNVNATASNVYSWEFYMNWSAPLLNVTNVAEGDFLKNQPGGTQFYNEIQNAEGYIYANCTVTGGGTTVTGSGALAEVTFLVEDNGNSTLHLYDTFLNFTLTPIPIDTVDGWFTNELHTLTLDSSPVSGIEFTLDGTPYTTPFSDELEDNYYTAIMPETQRISGKKYSFANWTDGSTNPTKVIDLTTDVSLTANYDIIPLPVHNIDIDYDYETIQEAIDASETLDGHTILVDAGTYYENVLLHKSLKLVGENSSNTIINGTLSGDVIEVAANNVTIKEFTIVNGDVEGIYIDGYGGTIISDNIIANCTWDAIALIFSNHNTISNNILIQNVYSGVFMDSCNNNTIYGNIIYLNGYGFEWYSSDNNTVVSNFFLNGTDGGILLDDCDSNVFYHNNFANNTQHVSLSASLNNAWNSSYPTGGNYWDDYSGIDLYSGPDQDILGSDGIGDTPYVVDVDNNDTYPLMNLWRGHVVINKALVSDNRCDISSQQTVSFHAKWSLTGSDITQGIIYVNGTEYFPSGTGWISFNTPAYDTVGKRLWNITGVLVEAFPSLNITTYVKAVDDPFIIWDRAIFTLDVVDDRIDVGDTANVTLTGYYEYDSASFAGTVAFNDTLTKDVVGGYWYTVASIVDPAYDLTVFESNSVYCIFDNVTITLTVNDDRIDVDSNASITASGVYQYDNEIYDGTITLNDTTIKSTVGKYNYVTQNISGDSHGITVFESNTVSVVFDKVHIDLDLDDNRIDVGTSAAITWTGYYEYDLASFAGTVAFNDTLTKDVVGGYWYTVASITDPAYDLSVFESDSVFCIFDRVSVTLSVSDTRIDVGSTADLSSSAAYEYDSTVYDGTVTLNDTELSKLAVGKYGYTVSSVTGDSYGISVFESNSVHCVFDRVQIVISVEDDRINIGNTADLSWTGTYEYDSSTFEGSITYNDTLSKTAVGKYGYETESISDTTYGLTTFSTNEVDVIFDKVTITLSVEEDTIEVDSNASITWTATYQYDGTDFDGTITLNDTSTKTTSGTYHYTTESISGDTYGITAFESNTITITFKSPEFISPWIIIGVVVIIGAAIAAIIFFMRRRSKP